MHTYKAINAMPDAKKDYKPEAISRSALDLAHHIAICDVGFLHAVAANSFSVFPANAMRIRSPSSQLVQGGNAEGAREGARADGNHLCQTSRHSA